MSETQNLNCSGEAMWHGGKMNKKQTFDHDPCNAKTKIPFYNHEFRVGMDFTFDDRMEQLAFKYEGELDDEDTREDLYEDFKAIARECFTVDVSYDEHDRIEEQ